MIRTGPGRLRVPKWTKYWLSIATYCPTLWGMPLHVEIQMSVFFNVDVDLNFVESTSGIWTYQWNLFVFVQSYWNSNSIINSLERHSCHHLSVLPGVQSCMTLEFSLNQFWTIHRIYRIRKMFWQKEDLKLLLPVWETSTLSQHQKSTCNREDT